MNQLTRTEAETLAVMIESAGHKMARVKTRTPGTDRNGYVWADATSPFREMIEGFYEVIPAEYGIFI